MSFEEVVTMTRQPAMEGRYGRTTSAEATPSKMINDGWVPVGGCWRSRSNALALPSSGTRRLSASANSSSPATISSWLPALIQATIGQPSAILARA